MAYLCTKFDHSSFSRSIHMIGAHQNLTGSHAFTAPLSRMVAVDGLALAMINLSTKFEVCASTHYEDRKGDTKIGWFGLWRS